LVVIGCFFSFLAMAMKNAGGMVVGLTQVTTTTTVTAFFVSVLRNPKLHPAAPDFTESRESTLGSPLESVPAVEVIGGGQVTLKLTVAPAGTDSEW
jgi:hypothetical protein